MRTFTRAALAAGILLIGTAVVSSGAEEKDRLAGTWKLVAGVRSGKKMKDKDMEGVTRTFSENRFTLKREDVVSSEGTFRLQPKTTPAGMDISMTVDEKESQFRGIYRFDGDRLVTCFAPARAERPKGFTSPEGSGISLLTWERVVEKIGKPKTKPTPSEPVLDPEPTTAPTTTEESPLAKLVRMRDKVPTGMAPQVATVAETGPMEFTLNLTLVQVVPETEQFTVKVGDNEQTRTRTVYKQVAVTKQMKALTKDLRVVGEDGKLETPEGPKAAMLLKKGAPVLLMQVVGYGGPDPRHFDLIKPGTPVLMMQMRPPEAIQPAPSAPKPPDDA